jgi:hypothetical protein
VYRWIKAKYWPCLGVKVFAGRPTARALLEISIEQDHLVAERKLVIGCREPAEHDSVFVARDGPAHCASAAQWQKRDVGRNPELLGTGPAGLIEDENGVRAGGDLGGLSR